MLVKNENQLLENARSLKLRRARKILIEIVNKAIVSADPSLAMRRWLRLKGERLRIGTREFDLSKIEKIVVVGGGKACRGMVEVLEEMLGYRITAGVVSVPEGTAPKCRVRKIELVEAGHPLPTEASVRGGERIMSLMSGLGPRDLVVFLLSGGGSALITLPADGISLDELQETTQLLLKSGASIQEVNAVRKHLSKIKGGRLARTIHPTRSVTLVISDVLWDKLDTIASSPTYPDSTTYTDALKVTEKYGIIDQVPKNVLRHLELGTVGEVPETPKPRGECFSNATHEIIASNTHAVKAAEEVGRSNGFNVLILTTTMQGEAREVGAKLAEIARKVIEKGEPVSRPALLISGGETTVTVRGEGKGGRNQELVLGAAIGISGFENTAIVSFSTDGIDGPTDAAGAVADSLTLERASRLSLDPLDYLGRNDSYRFFERMGDLLITGPTQTNVMDVFAAVII